MESILIYPPHHNYKLKDINFTFDLKKLQVVGPFINRNNKYWNGLYNKIDICFKNKKALPKGIYLYRCSTNKNPNIIKSSNDNNSKVLYFGLDFVIAIWIGLEINEKSSEYIPCYLHVYQIQKNIEYKYLYSNGNDGVPMELDPINCIKKPCLHPQEILHGDEWPYKSNELGTEISFPINNFNKIAKNIKPLKTFEIDIQLLKKNKEKYIFEWDPKNALKKIKNDILF
jgi:hypothetical protein